MNALRLAMSIVLVTSAVIVVFVIATTPPMAGIAQRIRDANSPLVDALVYRPRNWLDDPYVAVFLVPGTTREQAERFWCEVVVPAGGTGVQDDRRTVSVWDAESEELLLPRDGVECSGDGRSAP